MSEEKTYLRSLDDPVGILDCYQKWGAVGITGVLNKVELMETRTEVEALLKAEVGEKFNLMNSTTYHLTDTSFNAFGVIGNEPLFTPALARNRFHPNVQKAYSILYQTDAKNLVAQHDRVSWMRPTIGPLGQDWRKYRMVAGVHLDVDPIYYHEKSMSKEVFEYLNSIEYKRKRDLVHENNCKTEAMGRQLQGVLNIFDNNEEDGGFCFIPGGHLKLRDWYERRKDRLPSPTPNGRYLFMEADHEFKVSAAKRIPCPAGTLIIFDAALPHGTKPNYSDKQRMIQFMRYMPKATFEKKTLSRRRKFVDKCLAEIGYSPTKEEKTVI